MKRIVLVTCFFNFYANLLAHLGVLQILFQYEPQICTFVHQSMMLDDSTILPACPTSRLTSRIYMGG